MKYNINWAVQNKDEGFTFFWRPENHKLGVNCFSQWYESSFLDQNNTEYFTAEHYMMAMKAELFGDEYMHLRILKEPNPAVVRKMGRKVRNFDAREWDSNKVDIVKAANYYKFTQNEELLNVLLNTNDSIIVEASPFDKIWGIGLDSQNSRSKNPDQWRGENLLGFILMELRNELGT